MSTYIINVDEFDTIYAKIIADEYESSHDLNDELELYGSHLFAMFAAEMIEESKAELSEGTFRFLATIFWDWMGGDGIQINKSILDSEESMINSAIPSEKVRAIYDEVKDEDVKTISNLVFLPKDTEVFSSSEELEKYLSIWWSIFERASSEEKGVVIQAD